MTSIRQEAMELLERIPEDKLTYVIQIMRGVDGLIGISDKPIKKKNRFRPICYANNGTCRKCR